MVAGRPGRRAFLVVLALLAGLADFAWSDPGPPPAQAAGALVSGTDLRSGPDASASPVPVRGPAPHGAESPIPAGQPQIPHSDQAQGESRQPDEAAGPTVEDYVRAFESVPLGAYPRQEAGALIYEGPPPPANQAVSRFEQLSDWRQAQFAGFGPGAPGRASVLLLQRANETPQLYLSLAPGQAQQVTAGLDRVALALARPGHNQILYARDAAGDENFQFFLRGEKAADVIALTEPGTRNLTPVWTPDGSALIWARARGGDANYDLMWINPDEPASRRVLLAGVGAIAPLAFSADGERALIGRYRSIAWSERFVLDFKTGRISPVAAGAQIAFAGGVFAPDGRSVVVASDENSEFLQLVRIDLASGKRSLLADFGADVEAFAASPDLRILAAVVNRGGASEIWLVPNRAARKPLPPVRGPVLPPGVVTDLSFDESGRYIGFTFSASDAPGAPYVYDRHRMVLRPWVAAADPDGVRGLIRAAAFAFPSFDAAPGDGPDGKRRMIPGWILRPSGPGPHPVIISFHGGPESQARPEFDPTSQFLASALGAAVIEPNVRGSSGYGKTYLALDDGVRRVDVIKDVGALLDWVASQPDLDPKRVVVMGGSYGGFMTLAALAAYSDRLAGGVSMVGIADFPNFLANTAGYRRDLRRAEYGDERDPAIRAALEALSPANKLAQISRPLFVEQGLNDPRVPPSEAITLIERLRRSGREVWSLLARDEGHGFVRKSNNQFRRRVELAFFWRIFGLGPDAPPRPAP